MNQPPTAGQIALPPTRLIAVRCVFVVLGLAGWFATQNALGARAAHSTPEELSLAGSVLTRGDAILEWTAPWNAYLTEHRAAAHALLIVSSLLIDGLGVFLLGWSIFGRSLRPFLGLLLLFGLRQICQSLSALPAPQGMIWEPPGFPSLLVFYAVANDFFFSGHTALAVFGAVELGRFSGRRCRVAAFFIAVFLAGVVLVLRAHYTMDVFAGTVAALCAAVAAKWLAPTVDGAIARAIGLGAPA